MEEERLANADAGGVPAGEFGYTAAESRHGFKVHAVVYACVMTRLIVLNAPLWVFADVAFPWAVVPLIAWGIGLALHYVYGLRRAPDEGRARQRHVEELAERTREPVA